MQKRTPRWERPLLSIRCASEEARDRVGLVVGHRRDIVGRVVGGVGGVVERVRNRGVRCVIGSRRKHVALVVERGGGVLAGIFHRSGLIGLVACSDAHQSGGGKDKGKLLHSGCSPKYR
jgi:hypothetical protein